MVVIQSLYDDATCCLILLIIAEFNVSGTIFELIIFFVVYYYLVLVNNVLIDSKVVNFNLGKLFVFNFGVPSRVTQIFSPMLNQHC